MGGKNEKKRKIKIYMRKIGRESSKKKNDSIERFKKARIRRRISIIFFGVFL